ncbi:MULTISPECIES: M23 family metallopeptidase [Fusobacterium]|uniref:M23 family peptidase n=2 Tax=Fusobacterium varium TaxID=856 RepID=A0ABN5JKM3_FUSVA|nr:MULTISPECIES: M23 family metallopeptidase [Fusobacterium]AVQ31666.1 M23 family peptidase [Fusobacterium varium ATCC 27725]EES63008.1 peptidase, M23 family [Fusobacterium varium ATCC 27725]MCD7979935.1 M23 family metallopeptidase [Fusobacterium sp.]MCF0169762.1 M23 family metallopeptidase [Fusobacterium varium]MCF2672612.1 M23 family metallopeptidase [Fusobacterium varium]
MKNRFYITITDFRGVKCYSFDKIIKKYLFVVGSLFFTGLVLLIIMIFVLKDKVDEYSYFKLENEKLYTQIEENRKNLEEKNLELENISEKITEIERLMGEDSIANSVNLNEIERLDLTKLNIIDKKYLLQMIPNGNPVSPFSGYSSGFGGRFHPVLEQRKFHYGLDFVAKIGTSVLAPGDGIVEYAGFNSGGFGNLIILSHNFGFKTYFAHLSEIDVKVGDFITKGTVIGKTGNTGRSSGPHLHYEIHYLGKRMDPKNFAKWSLENYDYIFKNEKGVKWQSLIEMTKLQTQIIQQKN